MRGNVDESSKCASNRKSCAQANRGGAEGRREACFSGREVTRTPKTGPSARNRRAPLYASVVFIIYKIFSSNPAWALDIQGGNWIFGASDSQAAREEVLHQWATILTLEHLACPGMMPAAHLGIAAEGDQCAKQLSVVRKPVMSPQTMPAVRNGCVMTPRGKVCGPKADWFHSADTSRLVPTGQGH